MKFIDTFVPKVVTAKKPYEKEMSPFGCDHSGCAAGLKRDVYTQSNS